eukprot:CAMPEP_0184502594 /NCGR_PEP_ID=MMETSP0113_2-20130426/50809_1 /TAXON_ID=91329 /ORGANISM="Norrisiella sphaerica, Strain BC52" /LENGTH=51 /DNA_ID=CAMNT_0026891851 /DNA_START=274 /DNA_END=426 /DNA_ORIENTATION=-
MTSSPRISAKWALGSDDFKAAISKTSPPIRPPPTDPALLSDGITTRLFGAK